MPQLVLAGNPDPESLGGSESLRLSGDESRSGGPGHHLALIALMLAETSANDLLKAPIIGEITGCSKGGISSALVSYMMNVGK